MARGPSSPLSEPASLPSHDSSPRLSDDEDNRQAEQDRQLASSMVATASSRARSNTLLDRAQQTPARANSDQAQSSSSATRRRPSISVVNNGSSHLADQLEIQDREEGSGDRSADGRPHANALVSGGRFSGSRHTPQQHHGSAAAQMLYRHHRNVSDSSIDSQGGAYIDHRRQPHSLSLLTTPSNRAGQSQRSPEDYNPADRRRNQGRGHRERDEDEEDLMGDFSAGPSGEGVSSFSSQTARPSRLNAEDLEENAVADDFGGPAPPMLQHRSSQKSFMSRASIHDRRHLTDDEGNHHHLHGDRDGRSSVGGGSRPHSVTGDVCFPAHGGGPDADLLDINGLYGLPQTAAGQHPHGVPGVLSNFPFPFDFTALEEFAEREKEGVPISGLRRRKTGDVQQAKSLSVSPPGYGTSSPPLMGVSSGSEADALPARRMGRQRKLSESVHPGRYRRKLAQFEGTGDEAVLDIPPLEQHGSGTKPMFTTIMDTKTPLLNPAGGPNLYSQGRTKSAAAVSGVSSGARPYRFSFYSNALPSTIHARSLAEIPDQGQSFEELFVGRPTMPEDEESFHTGGADARAPFSPMASQNGTGANTPLRPGQNPRSRIEKPRSALIRSDVDAEANTWWLDIMCPTDSEMKVLSKVFGIHPLTSEDIQMEETREKIELFRNYYFVCFRSFEQDPYSPTYLEPLNMYIIVFREGTLSFHFRGTPHPQNVRRRIKQLKDYINVTSDWISYALIDDITDAFGPLIQNIEYEVDSIDELVLILKEAEQSDMLRRIGTCRKKVMGLLRLMGNKADVVKGLSKRCNENWSVAPKSDIGLYLSDIQDHITTSTQNLTHYEKILSRSHSNYLAQISIEMTDANNQINDVLSKLTALGTVLIPMNLVTGLWGMNVNVPGQGIESLHWFFGIVGCLGAIAMGGAWLTYKVFVRS